MAATASTLPLAHKNQYNIATTSGYDEFGLPRSSSAVRSGHDWDEEVVPALRKKLEEDSQILARRLNQIDSTQLTASSSSAYLQKPESPFRPGLRSKPSPEILQDGLGSDDLIPSEWVTGSSAQFHSLTPRSRSNYMDERRSPLASPQSDTSPPLQHLSNFSPTASPLSPYFPPQHISSSSSTEHPDDSIVKARTRAKKLARERSQTLLQSPSPAASDDVHEGKVQRRPSANVGKYKPRSRSSSPHHTTEDPEGDTERMRGDTVLRQGQYGQESLREASESASVSDMRKMKSDFNLTSSQYHRGPNTPLKARQTEGTIPTSQTYPRYEFANSMQETKVNDEFGPLGATPKRRLPSGFCEDDTARRTSSNPWDEEMLPAVKRRLEQQKMLEELGKNRDEDLVDTWDRNGLPLRKSPVTLKARPSTRSESINKLSDPHSPTKNSVRQAMAGDAKLEAESDRTQADLQAEVQAQRLKRLQEQLDMGLFASPSQPVDDMSVQEHQDDSHVEMQESVDAPSAVHTGIEADSRQEEQSHHQKDSQPLQRQGSELMSEKAEYQEARFADRGRESRQITQEKEVQGGCCSCTVM